MDRSQRQDKKRRYIRKKVTKAPTGFESQQPEGTSNSSQRRGSHKRNILPSSTHVITRLSLAGVPKEPEGIYALCHNSCGVIVREWVSITYKNWHAVPDDLMDLCWSRFQEKFQFAAIDQAAFKKWTLSTMGSCLR